MNSTRSRMDSMKRLSEAAAKVDGASWLQWVIFVIAVVVGVALGVYMIRTFWPNLLSGKPGLERSVSVVLDETRRF